MIRASGGRLAGGLPQGSDVVALWREYEAGKSAEARFVKACDKLDMARQAQRYSAEQGLELTEFIDSALSKLGDSDLAALVSA